MDGWRVAELLFAEFGHEQFLTKQISDSTMTSLVKLMGITESRHQVRNRDVGLGMGSLEGTEYTLISGERVQMTVVRAPDKRGNRIFQLVAAHGTGKQADGTKVEAGPAALGLAFDVVLTDSGYGYSVSCPALLGCHTQGLTEAEALENVREAITGWLKAESRAVKRRAQEMLDEYDAAGYPSKLAMVSIPPVVPAEE